ncbi:MAG: class I SAM-dependent rRNA methyltransferase [Ignavibacteriaceae bacterium]
MPKIILKKNEEKRLKLGHHWVFSNEIFEIEDSAENGDIIEVFDSKNNFLGTGFYNKNSLIAVRILSEEKIDDLYFHFKEKLNKAFELRKTFYPNRNSFRLSFSESDFLPGLILDKYNDTFVLQIYSFGMERNVEKIIKVLIEDFNAKNIFTKNENYFRMLEGLPESDEIYLGEIKPEIINDEAINYKIDFGSGHKTGFYFDQSDNRFFVEKLVKGKKVVDAFCNSGGFGLHAIKGGAASVTFVDSSSNEIQIAKNNFELNNFKSKAEFIVSDVFDFFEDQIKINKKFDVVIIDPPAFAKNKKSLPAAKKGYEKLNKLALQIINDDGFLVTSSCSHHLQKNDFIQLINSAAQKVSKKIQLIYYNSASLDHPQIPSMPETTYLKFAVFKVET